MHRFSKILLLTLGFGLVGVAVGFLTSTPAPAAPTSVPVTVVNTPSAPVPTAAQGTTAITGNVGISAGTKINVANVPDSNGNPTPLVVQDHTPTQPFHIVVCSDYGTQSGTCQSANPPLNSSIQVPTTTSDGHYVERMVIENVSGSCESFGQQVFLLSLTTTLFENSPKATTDNIFPASASASPLIQTVSQQTRLYADPGSQLTLSFGVTGTPANGSICSLILTGYLTTTTP